MSQGSTEATRVGVATPETERGLSRWESAAPIRYPDPDIVVLDPRFQHMVLGHAAIADGCGCGRQPWTAGAADA